MFSKEKSFELGDFYIIRSIMPQLLAIIIIILNKRGMIGFKGILNTLSS